VTLGLRIAFWNTSVSPVAKTRESPDLESLKRMIDYLLLGVETDLLVLCEISEAEATVIKQTTEISRHIVEYGVFRAGRGTHDICVIYKNNFVLLAPPEQINSLEGSRTYRAALRYDFRMPETESAFALYCCHWPSNLRAEASGIRERLAGVLRADLTELGVLDRQHDAAIVGDFNTEPHSNPIARHLLATRDKSLVAKKSHLLFNTSWDAMGTCCLQHENEEVVGTYFYVGGTETRWFTYDQIIASSSLVSGGHWQIADSVCATLCPEWYAELILQRKSHFDHLPISIYVNSYEA